MGIRTGLQLLPLLRGKETKLTDLLGPLIETNFHVILIRTPSILYHRTWTKLRGSRVRFNEPLIDKSVHD